MTGTIVSETTASMIATGVLGITVVVAIIVAVILIVAIIATLVVAAMVLALDYLIVSMASITSVMIAAMIVVIIIVMIAAMTTVAKSKFSRALTGLKKVSKKISAVSGKFAKAICAMALDVSKKVFMMPGAVSMN
jgi:hypothetical protein